LRSGPAHPGLDARLLVDYYGSPTPLQQLASFAVQDAHTILISPFDINALRDIEIALSSSEIGANPSNDGKVIRVVMPELNKERSQEYVKLIKSKAEDHRVSVRNSRRNAKETIDKMVDDGDIGKDEGHRAEKELDELTRKYVDQIDEMAKNKEDELLEV